MDQVGTIVFDGDQKAKWALKMGKLVYLHEKDGIGELNRCGRKAEYIHVYLFIDVYADAILTILSTFVSGCPFSF